MSAAFWGWLGAINYKNPIRINKHESRATVPLRAAIYEGREDRSLFFFASLAKGLCYVSAVCVLSVIFVRERFRGTFKQHEMMCRAREFITLPFRGAQQINHHSNPGGCMQVRHQHIVT